MAVQAIALQKGFVDTCCPGIICHTHREAESALAFMPYIHFSGTCAEAMRFYCTVFNGTDLQMMTYGNAPGAAGHAPSDRIMHSQFTAEGATLMASDMPPGTPDVEQQAISIMIDPHTVAEGQRLFSALSDGGQTIMPFGPTFWSPGFGMIEDRFGTHWIIGTRPQEPV